MGVCYNFIETNNMQGREMMRILIVEDEKNIRKSIVNIIRDIDDSIDIIEKKDGEAVGYDIKNNEIELFLLDISLPNGSGIQIAEKIRASELNKHAFIVFVTGHKEYELDGFKKYHCYDFLEKPFDKKRLINIVQSIKLGLSRIEKVNPEKAIILNLKNFILKIYCSEIFFLEIHDRKCTIHTTSGKHIVPNTTIKRFVEELPGDNFKQTHKSYLVNTDKIIKIEAVKRSSFKIYFENYDEQAFLGEKFQYNLLKN